MKIKKLIIPIAILSAGLLFTSCGNDNVDPFGKTEPTVITTTAEAETTTEETTTNEEITEKGKTLYATANVNVREQPNTSCKIVGSLSLGESIELIKHLDDGWSAVKYGGKEFYISTQYLQKKSPPIK